MSQAKRPPKKRAWAIFSASYDDNMIYCDLETGTNRWEAFKKVAERRKDECAWVDQGDNPCTYTPTQLRRLASTLERLEKEKK